MGEIMLVYSTRKTIGSALIRAFSRCWCSHVAILDGEYIIEATGSHGVRRVPFSEALAEYDDYAIVAYEVPRPRLGIDFARSKVGSKYDIPAYLWFMVGPVLRLIGHDVEYDHPKKFICSELANDVLKMAGRQLVAERSSKIKPRDLWIVNCGRVITQHRKYNNG
jgi:uncharacterized protein YycO